MDQLISGPVNHSLNQSGSTLFNRVGELSDSSPTIDSSTPNYSALDTGASVNPGDSGLASSANSSATNLSQATGGAGSDLGDAPMTTPLVGMVADSIDAGCCR